MATGWVSQGGSEDGRECSLITPSNRFMKFMVMMRKEATYNENDRAQPPDDKTTEKASLSIASQQKTMSSCD